MKTLVVALMLFTTICSAQQKSFRLGELTFGAGSYRGTGSISATHQWQIGKSEKFGVGVGARFTSFFGANLYYITAPAKLTSGSEGPQVIFKENIAANIDSFLIKSPQVNMLNLMINLEYRLRKIDAGFSIDFIGFSFGSEKRGNYINGPLGKNTGGKPSSFNILLISDNDKGSLNSELYFRYPVRKNLKIKVAVQFLFTEYTTHEYVQEFPEKNDRFRNKSLLFAVGISKIF